MSRSARSSANLAAVLLVLGLSGMAYFVSPMDGGPDFRSDSMSYLQMAKGISSYPEQPIGWPAVDNPAARYDTTFPIGFPLLIWLFTRVGMVPATAALAIPCLSLGLSALSVFFLLVHSTRRTTALIAVALLGTTYCIINVAWLAMTEMPAIAVALLAMWRCEWVRREPGQAKTNTRGSLEALAAGILVGLTFWLRYSMLSFIVAGWIGLAVSALRRDTPLRHALTFILSSSLVAVALLAINFTLGETLFGAHRAAASQGLIKNAATFANYTTANVLGFVGTRGRLSSVGVSVGLFGCICAYAAYATSGAVRKAKYGPWFYWSLAFLLFYPVFMITTRSFTEFNAVSDPRLFAPWMLVFLLAVMVPSIETVLEARKPWRTRFRPALALVAILAFIVGQHYRAGVSLPRLSDRLFWRVDYPGHESTAVNLAIQEIVASSGALLITNDKDLVYRMDPESARLIRGSRQHPVGQFSRAKVLGFLAGLSERKVYFYLQYNLPGFDPSALGPLAVDLLSGRATDFAVKLRNDGRGVLFQRPRPQAQ